MDREPKLTLACLLAVISVSHVGGSVWSFGVGHTPHKDVISFKTSKFQKIIKDSAAALTACSKMCVLGNSDCSSIEFSLVIGDCKILNQTGLGDTEGTIAVSKIQEGTYSTAVTKSTAINSLPAATTSLEAILSTAAPTLAAAILPLTATSTPLTSPLAATFSPASTSSILVMSTETGTSSPKDTSSTAATTINTTGSSTFYSSFIQVPTDAQASCGSTIETDYICCNGSIIKNVGRAMGCCGTAAYDEKRQGCCGSTVYDTQRDVFCCGTKVYRERDGVCCDGVRTIEC